MVNVCYVYFTYRGVISDCDQRPQNLLLRPLKVCFQGVKGQGKSWAPAVVRRGKFQAKD